MALVVVVVVILRPLVAHRSSKGAFWWLAGWLGSIYLSLSLCAPIHIYVYLNGCESSGGGVVPSIQVGEFVSQKHIYNV